ncbi:MAG: hypothetical protein WCV91_02965 [Candidatus Margulisiibacteriota bacterium]
MNYPSKILFILTIIFSCSLLQPLRAETYESQAFINETNWADLIGEHLGFLYDSHGCLHFTPSDIYLLVKTIPKKASLSIKGYSEKKIPAGYESVPIFRKQVNSQADVRRYADTFKAGKARLVVYPGLGWLFVLLGDKPIVKVKTRPGPEQAYKLVFDVDPDGDISWDRYVSTPTDPGNYKIIGATAHYLSNAYRDITIVPFGGWVVKQNGKWFYQNDDNKWYISPEFIASDLEQPYGKQDNNYFDVNLDKNGKITGARWAGNDFGKYALLWTLDGRTRYPELGYSEGQLLYEQTLLIKDLAVLLTVSGSDSFEACVENSNNLLVCRAASDFISSRGEVFSSKLDPVSCSYVKLFNGFRLTAQDQKNIDDRVEKAFRAQKAGKISWIPNQRQEQAGLYNFVRDYDNAFDKSANWYGMVRDHWDVFGDLRAKLRRDYDKYGLYSQANRVIALEKFINDRLEFKQIVPPASRKTRISFSDFFVKDDEPSLFDTREKAAIRELIRAAASGEAKGAEISSVTALNNYNFGVLLNEMLGDLYKSHGCLHVSPLNVHIMNKLLPVGAKLTIKPYSEKADPALFKLPLLADLVNFDDDIAELAKQFSTPTDVRVVVYPGSRLWVIYLKDKGYASMKIEPGFQTKVNLMKGRDPSGKPLFQNNVAYPTSDGNYSILKKLVNYVSNLYYDTTIVPQGAQLRKEGSKWLFFGENKKWAGVPDAIQSDLGFAADQRIYEYYDLGLDDNGNLLRAKWGSNTFGKYPILLSTGRQVMAPELVHTTGDLMMEQRRLIGDLIRVMASTFEGFDSAIKQSRGFANYSTCYQFIKDPQRTDLLEPFDSACYKAYMDLPLNDDEKAALPADVFACYKSYKGKEALSQEEADLLVKEGLATWKGNDLKVDDAKVYGVLYDLYEYVVAIRKNANIYSTLKEHWSELSGIRQAFLQDFKKLSIKDPTVFSEFIRELVSERSEMKRLTQSGAYQTLNQLLEDS